MTSAHKVFYKFRVLNFTIYIINMYKINCINTRVYFLYRTKQVSNIKFDWIGRVMLGNEVFSGGSLVRLLNYPEVI